MVLRRSDSSSLAQGKMDRGPFSRIGMRSSAAHARDSSYSVCYLYRLRWAISRLWNDYRPALGSIFPPNLETIQALVSFKAPDRLQKNQG